MGSTFPAIEGIGGSYLYLVDRYGAKGIYEIDFVPMEAPRLRSRPTVWASLISTT